MLHLLVIANADAGTADAEAVDIALATLRAEAEVSVARTADLADVDRAIADHPGVAGVVVLGGDGSLHTVVAALDRAERLPLVTVGLVPLGTGNDFARTIELPTAPAEAAAVILAGSARSLDLARTADGEIVVNAVHVGVGAEAAAAARPWKKILGPAGYAVGALMSGLTQPGARVEVEIDGRRLARGDRVVQVAVGLGRYVGGGTPLLPEADPGDGLLDVAVSYASPLPRRLAYAWHLRGGRHHERDDVVYERGTTVTVRGDALRATNDGEISAPATTHTWRIEPAAWRLYAPADATTW